MLIVDLIKSEATTVPKETKPLISFYFRGIEEITNKAGNIPDTTKIVEKMTKWKGGFFFVTGKKNRKELHQA